jgi:isovaleryl-CoA dehydrogenase
MNFDLPEELEMLRESVIAICEKDLIPGVKEYEERAEFCYPLIRKMGEAGLFGAPFPEELGGSAAGFQALSVISEEVARLAPGFSYAMNMQCATCPYTIYNWGTPEQGREFVPGLISGEKIGMFALSEEGSGSDPAGAMRTTARREGGVYKLNGSKMWITFSHAADVGVLFAKTDTQAEPVHSGITAFIVQPKRFDGYSAQPIDLPGLSKSLRSCAVFLDDFEVPVEQRLGEEGEGFSIAMNALEYGRLTVSGRLTGLAQACLDVARNYANERVIGGRPISKHQLIQERIADATVAVEASRLMARRIGWTMDQGRTSTRVASRGKYFATQTARLCADMVREVLGGNALTAEYPVVELKAYIDMLTVGEGSENVQRLLIGADSLGIKDAARHTMRNRFAGIV